ncbi:MAG: hypothetical protein HF314_16735 [Ignavibacteria bacterium]|jgi:hypothetical protein|nr:hypothetical protein [Ignavibacteria bacterium]MCU7504731.1 hypothetical protein [Ignavibacteria bacterium]MCU7516333.1 hypothetical protein [Ignavibacteria bacterium]
MPISRKKILSLLIALMYVTIQQVNAINNVYTMYIPLGDKAKVVLNKRAGDSTPKIRWAVHSHIVQNNVKYSSLSAHVISSFFPEEISEYTLVNCDGYRFFHNSAERILLKGRAPPVS